MRWSKWKMIHYTTPTLRCLAQSNSLSLNDSFQKRSSANVYMTGNWFVADSLLCTTSCGFRLLKR